VDLTTIGGLVLGVVSLVVAFMMEGGTVGALIQFTAVIIVFGGTLGAVLVSYPIAQLQQLPGILKVAFFYKRRDFLTIIDDLVELASTARREGILALEEGIENHDDDFFKNGIRLVVDGVDPDLVRSILETELSFIESRHETAAGIFETAGGFAPTMGIIGTVMGLVHVLGNLQDVSKLGPLIATAFIATLYGVGSANVVYLPLGNKLKTRSKEEVLGRELMIEGILSIQAGENPSILRHKLKAFLAPKMREATKKQEAETDAETA